MGLEETNWIIGEELGVEEKGWEWMRRIGSRGDKLDYRRRRDAFS